MRTGEKYEKCCNLVFIANLYIFIIYSPCVVALARNVASILGRQIEYFYTQYSLYSSKNFIDWFVRQN